MYISGYFNYIGGQARDAIAAVSALTGTPTPWLANASREVKQVVVSDGVVYAAGAFSSNGMSSTSQVDGWPDRSPASRRLPARMR